MSRTIGRFGARVIKMGRSHKLPFHPFVEVVLDSWMSGETDKTPVISAQLMTDREIDEYVEALKEDLDAAAKNAKAGLRRAKEETTAIVDAKIKARKAQGREPGTPPLN